MTAYIVRRLLGAIPLLLIVSLVSYALMGLSPGGPGAILGHQAHGLTPAMRARFIARRSSRSMRACARSARKYRVKSA